MLEQKLEEFESLFSQIQLENSRICEEYNQLNAENTKLENGLVATSHELKSVTEDLENKIRMLATENERLTELLDTAKLESANNH